MKIKGKSFCKILNLMMIKDLTLHETTNYLKSGHHQKIKSKILGTSFNLPKLSTISSHLSYLKKVRQTFPRSRFWRKLLTPKVPSRWNSGHLLLVITVKLLSKNQSSLTGKLRLQKSIDPNIFVTKLRK